MNKLLDKVLVVVHPGSLCGSANFNLGPIEARAARDRLASELKMWNGAVLILDGALSDELGGFPILQRALNEAVVRARMSGLMGIHVPADDPDHPQIALATLLGQGVSRHAEIFITGAWFHAKEDGYGCVNATRDALVDDGFQSVNVLESAAILMEAEVCCGHSDGPIYFPGYDF